MKKMDMAITEPPANVCSWLQWVTSQKRGVNQQNLVKHGASSLGMSPLAEF